MSQKTVVKPLEIQLDTVIHFIRKYRELEKASYADGFILIHSICREKSALFNHVCDHWRWKKKDFGVWWLNLDACLQISLNHVWQIQDPDDSKYLETFKENPITILYAEQPVTLSMLKKIQLFFNNHGIHATCVPGLKLNKLPKENKRYGNSANWGDYILSLPRGDQKLLIEKILAS